MAEGFYYLSHVVRDWTSHPDFRRPEPKRYFDDCLSRIDHSTDWFFTGHHGYLEPHAWPDL
jgi:hypothetical protein